MTSSGGSPFNDAYSRGSPQQQQPLFVTVKSPNACCQSQIYPLKVSRNRGIPRLDIALKTLNCGIPRLDIAAQALNCGIPRLDIAAQGLDCGIMRSDIALQALNCIFKPSHSIVNQILEFMKFHHDRFKQILGFIGSCRSHQDEGVYSPSLGDFPPPDDEFRISDLPLKVLIDGRTQSFAETLDGETQAAIISAFTTEFHQEYD
ncbi:hypothetical protein BU23DRAFT_572814 [Bimuria novae-zelandiae CBS 107.79]|uniref:Uncharacterized protein n=1 Tax=Bimuria novae-zelandiae CBS 107.79 TaxID=1447943 RepID=A0A6A5V3E6_9PLEO|nr:hypothetical protein BU23DRAFT_572814 [Bimuria novae-zelandiae CBS 107.79]